MEGLHVVSISGGLKFFRLSLPPGVFHLAQPLLYELLDLQVLVLLPLAVFIGNVILMPFVQCVQELGDLRIVFVKPVFVAPLYKAECVSCCCVHSIS